MRCIALPNANTGLQSTGTNPKRRSRRGEQSQKKLPGCRGSDRPRAKPSEIIGETVGADDYLFNRSDAARSGFEPSAEPIKRQGFCGIADPLGDKLQRDSKPTLSRFSSYGQKFAPANELSRPPQERRTILFPSASESALALGMRAPSFAA